MATVRFETAPGEQMQVDVGQRLRERRLRRKVANDALVDNDTVRYSVPHRLVRTGVEVLVGESEVRLYSGADLVATHARTLEPHTSVIDFAHYRGLWRLRSFRQ